MTRSPRRQPPPARYRLRVAGHLDQHWSPWFGDLTLTRDDDGTTSLTGVVADQSELHGLLTKIRDLGVPLISVETVGPRHGVDDAADSHPTHEAAGERRTVQPTTLEDT
jgi:hypothetical protein